jgi:hypothetical protein
MATKYRSKKVFTISVTVDTSKLDKIIGQIKPRAEAILDKVAYDVESDAKIFAPVLTGTLRASIHVIKPRALVRFVLDGVEYGIYQEFGTSRFGARPFIIPAIEKNRIPFEKAWNELIVV